MLFADFVYDILVLHSSYAGGNPVDAVFLLNYVLLAAAALHPKRAARPSTDRAQTRGNRAWLPLVAIAGFVSPLILLTGAVFHVHVDVGVLAGTSIALMALSVVRAAWLFGRLRTQTTELRERGESLQAALATQQALEADLRHEAFHDSLTGLANRALLHDRVQHALEASTRRHGSVALFFCDLDGFKGVNDSLGHHAGDELLVVAAKRLTAIVRPGDSDRELGACSACGTPGLGASTPPTPRTISLNCWRSSPRWIASMSAPMSSTPYWRSTPRSCSSTRG